MAAANASGNTAKTGATQVGGQCIGLSLSPMLLKHALQSLSVAAPITDLLVIAWETPVSEAMVIVTDMLLA